MAVDAHAVLAGEGDDLVGAVKPQAAIGQEDIFHLHFPFGGQPGEMRGSKIGPGGIAELRRPNGDTQRR